MQNSLNPVSIIKSIEISERHKGIVKLALGLFPVDALKLSDNEITKWIRFIEERKDRIVAIGEVGLDHHWVKDKDEQERQKKIFWQFISLSEKIKKPLIVHSRESEKDAFDMLRSSKAKAVFHCFNGPLQLAKKAENAGYLFSLPASVTFIQAFQDLAAQLSMESILAETDSPYMSPFKGQRNEPAFVVESYKKIAALKGKDLKETAEAIAGNYRRLFG